MPDTFRQPPEPPASSRVFVAGSTGSGKSWLVRRLLLPRYPRALIIDPLGSYSTLTPASGVKLVARSIEETRAALREAPKRSRSWWIVSQISAEEAVDLASLLLPSNLNSRPAYSLAVGGLALVCEECDWFVPQSATPAVRALWQRGRHVGLSIVAVSQRAALVNRVVTSMSQLLVMCATHEPNDVKYWRETTGEAGAAALDHLTPFGAVLFTTATRKGERVDSEYRVQERF